MRLGIDIGGTTASACLVSGGRIRAFRQISISSGPSHRPGPVLERIIREFGPFARAAARAGVGVAGDVDFRRGVVRYSPNLGWRNVAIARLLVRRWKRRVRVDNDANAAAWGAYHFYRRRYPNLLALTLGTGVGGGLVLEGRLYRGTDGSAGELGHVTVDPRGPRCSCGGRGCLEAFLARARLSEEARRKIGRRMEPEEISRRAARGSAAARQIWREYGRWLGIGIGSYLNIFNPDAVVLVGGVSRAWRWFRVEMRRQIRFRAFATARARAKILRPPAPERLGCFGAALL